MVPSWFRAAAWADEPGWRRKIPGLPKTTGTDTGPCGAPLYRTRTFVESFPDSSNGTDRKSTRLNSSHLGISYAVFCLKKKNKSPVPYQQRPAHHVHALSHAVPHS